MSTVNVKEELVQTEEISDNSKESVQQEEINSIQVENMSLDKSKDSLEIEEIRVINDNDQQDISLQTELPYVDSNNSEEISKMSINKNNNIIKDYMSIENPCTNEFTNAVHESSNNLEILQNQDSIDTKMFVQVEKNEVYSKISCINNEIEVLPVNNEKLLKTDEEHGDILIPLKMTQISYDECQYKQSNSETSLNIASQFDNDINHDSLQKCINMQNSHNYLRNYSDTQINHDNIKECSDNQASFDNVKECSYNQASLDNEKETIDNQEIHNIKKCSDKQESLDGIRECSDNQESFSDVKEFSGNQESLDNVKECTNNQESFDNVNKFINNQEVLDKVKEFSNESFDIVEKCSNNQENLDNVKEFSDSQKSHDNVKEYFDNPEFVDKKNFNEKLLSNKNNKSNESILSFDLNKLQEEKNTSGIILQVQDLNTVCSNKNSFVIQTDNDNKEALNIKSTLVESSEKLCINESTVESIVADQSNTIDNLEVTECKEPFSADSTSVNSMKITPNDSNVDISKTVLKNKNITTISPFSKSSEPSNSNFEDKNTNTLINKIHEMKWLKNDSSSKDNINISSKHALKCLRRKSDRCDDFQETNKFNSNKQSKLEQQNVQQVKFVQYQSIATPVWNSNASKQVFSTVQSAITNKVKDEEKLNLALTETNCTAQQESESHKGAQKNVRFGIQDDADDNQWNKIHQNLDDLKSTSLNEINSNQNCSDIIDKFGKVGGYTEKHVYLGKGARPKEQEFFKPLTYNGPQQRRNPRLAYAKPFTKTNEESNFYKCKGELQSENQFTNQNKQEIQIPIKGQERPIHGRVGKESVCIETNLSSNKNQHESGFNQEVAKNIEHRQKERFLKPNQDSHKLNEVYTQYSQSNFNERQNFNKNQSYRNQNQDYNRNQNYFNKNLSYFNKNQDYFNRNQNYMKNHETNRNQDYNKNQASNEYLENRNKSDDCRNKNQVEENWNETNKSSKSSVIQKYEKYNQQTCNQIEFKNKKDESISSHKFDQYKNPNLQENKKDMDKHVDVSKNMKKEQQNINFDLQKNKTDLKKESNNSSEYSQTSHQTISIINDSKSDISKSDISITVSNSNKTFDLETKSNIMTFKDNQNDQCTSGLNSNTCNPTQTFNQQIGKSNAPTAGVINSHLPSNLNSNTLQNVSFSQTTQCSNFNTPILYPNNTMNLNALPFNEVNINKIPYNQYSNAVETTISDATYSYLPAPNTDISIESQIRMNEISNSSQELLKLHDIVRNLSKQLAYAQATLLAAQVKFNHKALLCSSSAQNQLNQTNIPCLSNNQTLVENFNHPLPTRFSSMEHTVPPDFLTLVHNKQKTQLDTLDLPKNFTPVDVHNFTTDKFTQNITAEQRANFETMYNENQLLYHQVASFQPHSTNANRSNMMQQNSELKELKDNNQFYN